MDDKNKKAPEAATSKGQIKKYYKCIIAQKVRSNNDKRIFIRM